MDTTSSRGEATKRGGGFGEEEEDMEGKGGREKRGQRKLGGIHTSYYSS